MPRRLCERLTLAVLSITAVALWAPVFAYLAGCHGNASDDADLSIVRIALREHAGPGARVALWYPARDIPSYRDCQIREWDDLIRRHSFERSDATESLLRTAISSRTRAATSPVQRAARVLYRDGGRLGDAVIVFGPGASVAEIIEPDGHSDLTPCAASLWDRRETLFPD